MKSPTLLLRLLAATTATASSLAAGEYTFAVTGQAQVPFNKDPNIGERPNSLVSIPSRPITLVVKAPRKEVRGECLQRAQE